MTTTDERRTAPDAGPEPGTDILPKTPVPAPLGERPRTEADRIEDEGEPFGADFA